MEFDQIFEKISELLVLYGLKIITAIIILIVGRWIAMGVRNIVRRLIRRANVDEIIVSFVGSLVYVALLAFVVIAALGQLGIHTTSFIAILGAAGLAIGLALQGSLANFAAGFLMIIFRPFRVEDYIEGGGIAGTVEEIQIFTTTLKTPDNKTVIVPNAKMTGDNIINWSAKGTRRVDMVFGIGYGDDIKKAKQILERICREDSRVLDDPAPTVAVSELADSSVNFVVRPWVKTPDYWAVYFDLTERVKLTFDREGVSIPFPQHDVHLYQQGIPEKG